MSWGERSCSPPYRRRERLEPGTCNVDCPGYKHDGHTAPDTISRFDRREPDPENGFYPSPSIQAFLKKTKRRRKV